jgi:hypothetical protein
MMSFENHFAHDEEFADFCVRLLKAVFKQDSFQKFGKRGESQDGIDIIDFSHSVPFRAAQCKLHEPQKTCPPEEIREEVRKAAASDFALDEYYIITSGRKTRFADVAVLELNGKKPFGQRFTTYVWSWQEIQTKLDELDVVARDRVLNAGKNRSVESFRAVFEEVRLTSAPNSLTSQSMELQTRFTKVESHIKADNRELAKYELEQIDAIPTAMRFAEDRYLVHRLNAKYLMLIGEYDQAARRFLNAFDEQPELDQAMINRAIALELLGQKDEAWRQAEQLLAKGLRTEPLPALAYRLAPKPHSESTFAYYRQQLSTSEDLNLVIADQARIEGRLEDSVAACNHVLAISNRSSRAFLLRAFANHSLAMQGDQHLRRERLELAECDYQAARDNESERLPDNLRADLFRNLANVQFLIGRQDPSPSFEEAIRVARDKSPYVEQYLSYLCARSDFKTAGKMLDQYGIDPSQKNQRFLKLIIEKNNSQTSDDGRFITQMLAMYEEGEFNRRDECLGFVVQWSIDGGQAKDAIASLNGIKDTIDPFEFHCCMAWLQHVEQDDTAAKNIALRAKSLMVADSPENYVYLLGSLFVELEDDENALPILEQAADWSRLTPETRSLLDCAQRLQKHDVMLEVCQTLRKNKSDNKQTRSLELQVLYGYVPNEAKSLIHELLQQHPDDRQLYAWRCHIETRLNGFYDAIDVTRLPLAYETTVFDSQRVIGPFLAAEKFGDAIRYAYEILRCNQGDEIAHGRYMWLFTEYAGKSDLVLGRTEVTAECTVLYRESGQGTQSVTITADSNGSRFDGEISPDSNLAKALIGAKACEQITLSERSLQPRVVTIEAVLSKYVYRYQQVMQNFQLNFPHANTIQMLTVMDGDELNVSMFKKSLGERRKHVDFVVDLFKQNPLPVSALATWIGIEYREAFEYLSTNPEIGIRCCLTDMVDTDLSAPKKVELKNKKLVLDQSALLTIENLDIWSYLKNFQLVVMRSVSDVFESHVEELEKDRSKGTMGISDEGRLFLHESSVEEKQKRVAQARLLTSNIHKHCRIEESLAAASVTRDLREAFDKVGAFPSLDSIAYSKGDANLLLWTDEVFMHAVARNDFNLVTISVQDFLKHLRESIAISNETMDTLNANLLGRLYNPIEWNPDVAFAAARLSNWESDRQPFKEVLRQFGSKHWSLREKCDWALKLFIKIYRSKASDLRETQLLLGIMNAIGDRRAADLIRSDAYRACFPDEDMLESIRVSLDVWREGWLGK